MQHTVGGKLSIMSLPDIMQWAESNRKTGTLVIRIEGAEKSFYFQEGRLIFVSSQKKGERLGEFLSRHCRLDVEDIKKAIHESRRLGMPFTGYLISERIIDRNRLEQAIMSLAATVFTDALKAGDGTFEFINSVPHIVLNGPIKLNASYVVFESLKQYDEEQRGQRPDRESIIKEVTKRLSDEDIEIPPVPDILVKLNELMQRDDVAVQDIVKIVMSDQILTSKVLKVVNSAFYSPPSRISSLQQAIIYMGMKSLLSIVTFYTLSSIASRHAESVKEILRHSLLCAFIARKLATPVHIDPEETFVCGLLHDIGKTVIINLLDGYDLTPEERDAIVKEYHQGTGSLLSTKWNFPEVVRYAVRFHHTPSEALAHRKTVETVYLSNIIAHNPDGPRDEELEQCRTLDTAVLDFSIIFEELDSIAETAAMII